MNDNNNKKNGRISPTNEEILERLDNIDVSNAEILAILQEIKYILNRTKTPIPMIPQPEYPYSNKCSVCGIEMNHLMGYCCARSDCPSGLGPTASLTTNGWK